MNESLRSNYRVAEFVAEMSMCCFSERIYSFFFLPKT